jgi:hypothetical protein
MKEFFKKNRAGIISGLLLSTITAIVVIECSRPRLLPIPLDTASVLISDLLNNSALYDLSTKYKIGGEFPDSLFNVHPDSSGIMLWFCKDDTNKDFFLELEYVKGYDSTKLPQFPVTNRLFRPLTTFPYPRTEKRDTATIKRIVKTSKYTSNAKLQTIDSATAIHYIKAFRKFQSPGGTPKFCKYNFCYIVKNYWLDDFRRTIGNKGYGRYYLGYEKTDAHGRPVPNKIRLILTGVDQYGASMVKGLRIPMGQSGATAIDPILQSSWPPPPWK